MTTLYERARAAAERILQEQIQQLPAVRSSEEALRVLHQVELDVQVIGVNLTRLNDAALLTQQDVFAFDRLRNNLRNAQVRLLLFIRNVFAGHTEVLRQLPQSVSLAPSWSSTAYPPTTDVSDSPDVRNMSGWAIAGIIIAILIALGLMVYLGSRIYNTFDGLVDLYVLQEQGAQMRELYDARLHAYQECVRTRQAAGQPINDCMGAAAQLIPTPRAALQPLPTPKGSSALWWFIGGMAVVAGLVGVGVYYGTKRAEKEPAASTKGIRGRKSVRGYRELDEGDFDEEHDSDYQLEVGR